eukprot:gene34397-46139_t
MVVALVQETSSAASPCKGRSSWPPWALPKQVAESSALVGPCPILSWPTVSYPTVSADLSHPPTAQNDLRLSLCCVPGSVKALACQLQERLIPAHSATKKKYFNAGLSAGSMVRRPTRATMPVPYLIPPPSMSLPESVCGPGAEAQSCLAPAAGRNVHAGCIDDQALLG